MRELKQLDKSLLVKEFDLSRDIWEVTQREGYGAHRAAGIIYKHGYLDGRGAMKLQKTEAYYNVPMILDTFLPKHREPDTVKQKER